MNVTHQSVEVVLSSLMFTLYMYLLPKPFRIPYNCCTNYFDETNEAYIDPCLSTSCLIKSVDVGTVCLSGAGELVTHLASVYSHLTIPGCANTTP